MQISKQRFYWIVIAINTAFLIAGITYINSIYSALSQDKEAQSQLLLETSKVTLSFILVTILGSFFAYLYKRLERERKIDAAIHKYREDFLKTLLDTFKVVQKTRRSLAIIGFTVQYERPILKVAPDTLDTYFKYMIILEEQQLNLERLWIEIDNLLDSFNENDPIKERLKKMDDYLRDIGEEFEENWLEVKSMNELDLTSPKFEKLISFTMPSKANGSFGSNFVGHMKVASELIRQELLSFRDSRSK